MKLPVFIDNVVHGTNIFTIEYDESPGPIPFSIPIGKYETLTSLVTILNAVLGEISNGEGLPILELNVTNNQIGIETTTAIDTVTIKEISSEWLVSQGLSSIVITYGLMSSSYTAGLVEVPSSIVLPIDGIQPMKVVQTVVSPISGTIDSFVNLIYSQCSILRAFGYTDGTFAYDPGTLAIIEPSITKDTVLFRSMVYRIVEPTYFQIYRIISAEKPELSHDAVVDYASDEWAEFGGRRPDYKSTKYLRCAGTVNFLLYGILPDSLQQYVDTALV